MDNLDQPVVTELVRPGDVRRGLADVDSIVVAAFDAYAGRLRELSEAKTQAFRKKFAGEEVEVLLEGPGDVCQNEGRSETVWTGFSENYLPVEVSTDSGFRGKLVRCRLELNTGGSLAGKTYPGRKEAAEGI